jgi:porin
MSTSTAHPALRTCLAGAIATLLLQQAAVAASATQPASSPATQAVGTAAAEPASSMPSGPLTLNPFANPTLAPDSIDEELLVAQARPAGILKYGPVSLIDPWWKKLNNELDKVGLKVGLAYTATFQASTNGPGTRTVAGGDFDLFGNWRLWGPKDDPNNGFLYFSTEYRHDLGTDIAPSALGGQIGALWGTTNGFGEQAYTVKELYWEQRFDKDKVILRLGKIDAENYYNSNYWQSDNLYFLNQAFSSFPARAFPSNGIGLNVTIKPDSLWYISTGFQDAQGKKTRVGFDTFFGDFNLFSALEIGFKPTIEGLGSGTYRFTGWYRDSGDSNGKPYDTGFDLSFDQHITKNLIPFFRYGVGKGNVNGLEQMVSTGIGWQGKLLTETDVIGVAGAWGRSKERTVRDQFLTEIFYRLQVSPDNQLTVGYQVLLNPTTSHDVEGILELRWRITF